MKLIRYFLLLLLALPISSCYQAGMKDDSSNPANSNLIGRKYRLKEDLIAKGMCFACPKNRPAQYISLEPKSGGYIKKMDVVSMGELRKGTIIQLVSVKITTDWIAKLLDKIFDGDDYKRLVYKELGSEQLKGLPIEIYARDEIRLMLEPSDL